MPSGLRSPPSVIRDPNDPTGRNSRATRNIGGGGGPNSPRGGALNSPRGGALNSPRAGVGGPGAVGGGSSDSPRGFAGIDFNALGGQGQGPGGPGSSSGTPKSEIIFSARRKNLLF